MASERPKAEWIEKQRLRLAAALPAIPGPPLFLPSDEFYSAYDRGSEPGLRRMAADIFAWLRIDSRECHVDFYEDAECGTLCPDIAGFYAPGNGGVREAILINARYKSDPLAVGAILAHESMHLYLERFKLRLQNDAANEQLTDLATIDRGLAVLVLNGMSQSARWRLALLMLLAGRIQWKTETHGFGYFSPEDYGKWAWRHARSRGAALRDVLGRLKPSSRGFLAPWGALIPSRDPAPFIRELERRNWRESLMCAGAAAILLAASWSPYVLGRRMRLGEAQAMDRTTDQRRLETKASIERCKSKLDEIERALKKDARRAEEMRARMESRRAIGEIKAFNDDVIPYSGLSLRIKRERDGYQAEIGACNDLIRKYNALQD